MFNNSYSFELSKKLYSKSVIFPRKRLLFRALELTPFENIKVVILGQDPYHDEGQANGLAFSVPKDIKIPPSLKNIYKELNNDLGIPIPNHGDLSKWAKEGVLLLNSILTVEPHKPASHRNMGWEEYTDGIIKEINDKKEHIVFILWGNYAQEKGKYIDESKHLVIKSPHPSPFSARKGFFNSKPFSRCNTYLKENGIGEIDWRIE
ncbi:MAG: uracil-DNA glycosylase [Candidatus Dojkabacteria bacterium]|nr:uracil-DNA glycosylase [Candidatus Dojkabacteria bacterium]